MSESTQKADDLPPVWNIRSVRCADFHDRSDLLEQLHGVLAEQHVCILEPPEQDMQGIGVSALAREYAYAHANDYQVVWWMDSQYLAAMKIEFAQLGNALDLVNNTRVLKHINKC